MGWRYETKSTIITTNRPIAKWGLVLGNPMVATAIIDCLVHHCTAISINDDSYRLKEHKIKKWLTNNLQATKELKPEWHNCRCQDLSARGATYLTVDTLHRESKAADDCSAATLPVNCHRWAPPFLWGFRCPGGAVLRLA